MSSACPFAIRESRIYGEKVALFRVELTNGKFAFLKAKSEPCYVPTAVVLVDAKRFLRLWRRSRPNWLLGYVYGALDALWRHLGRSTAYADAWLPFKLSMGWRADYKFKHAEAGFAEGENNPVPLARVNYGPLGLSFTDGITRTIWLLANGAKSFPVEVVPEVAQLLATVAGVTPSAWHVFDYVKPPRKPDPVGSREFHEKESLREEIEVQ